MWFLVVEIVAIAVAGIVGFLYARQKSKNKALESKLNGIRELAKHLTRALERQETMREFIEKLDSANNSDQLNELYQEAIGNVESSK